VVSASLRLVGDPVTAVVVDESATIVN
jgi:hypothetical protein